jgi:cleavage and polyadenylation specificity factor subunit 1
MTLFGKDGDGLEVMAAEFLPDGKQLNILAADGDSNIHVLQYDPEGKQKFFP